MEASRKIIGRWPVFCFLLAVLWGCGGGELDEEDELGVEEEEDADRYELVILEPEPADSTAADTTAARPAEEGSGNEDIPRVQKENAEKSGTDGPGETPGTPVVFDPQGDFTVQIGHYQDTKAASRMVRELGAEGYPVYAIASPDGKGVRVRIGYFKTREDAQRFGRIFKADRKMEFWVDTRASEK